MNPLRRPSAVASIHVPLYLLMSVVWILVLGVAVAGVLVATHGVAAAVQAPEELFSAGVIGALSVVQIAVLGALAVALGLLIPAGVPPSDGTEGPLPFTLPIGKADAWARLVASMALRRPGVTAVVAVLGGLTVWSFPSWIAEQLIAIAPEGYETSLELITRLLAEGEGLDKALLVGAIVVSAPLFEEIIFRGYIWRAFEWSYGPRVALVGSTLLFALYHMDPVHVVSLLPTAFFLGWLRYVSRSIWPAMLGHLANNGIAAALSEFVAEETLSSYGLGASLLGLAFTLLVTGLGWLVVRRARAPEPSPADG